MQFFVSKHVGQFTPTSALNDHMLKYVNEHGTGGCSDLTLTPWCDAVLVWAITNENNDECGYAWWEIPKSSPESRIISIAVFDQFAGKGAATIALKELETEASKIGVNMICAQVNNNCENTGLRARKWLLNNGYQIIGPILMTAEKYIEKWPNPICFQKMIRQNNP